MIPKHFIFSGILLMLWLGMGGCEGGSEPPVEGAASVSVSDPAPPESSAGDRGWEDTPRLRAQHPPPGPPPCIPQDLPTGSLPYRDCYGENPSCEWAGCSRVRVTASRSYPVVVIIKRSRTGRVVAHVYIDATDTYTLEVPNGTYDIFFYHGKDWCPSLFMKEAPCGRIYGGFLRNSGVGKDESVTLKNVILTYELILQPDGNFMPEVASIEEAL